MHSHGKKHRCLDCRKEGYDIARWLMLKEVLDTAGLMKTRAGKRMMMRLAEHLVQKMVDYHGDIPDDLPEWAIDASLPRRLG